MPNYSTLNPQPGFLSSLNYPGSSGYGTTRGRYGQNYDPVTINNTPDYAVYDTTTGKYKSIKTGQAWTGKLPGGQTTQNGAIVDAAASTDPNDRYKAVSVIKDPTGATQADTLSATYDKTAADSLKGWDQYVKDYTAQTDLAKKASAAATNVDPTISDLTAAQQRYSAGLDTASRDYAGLNADEAARQRAIIAQQQTDLGTFDQAKENERAAAQGAAEKLVSRYGLSKGGNLGLGSDVASLALNEAYKASIPIDLAKEQRRYDISQGALGLEGRLQGAEAQRIGSFQPQILGAQYSSAGDLATHVQNLRTAVANQDWNTATQIMNIPAVQAQVRNSIMSGDQGMLAALQQLRANARYQGLQDTQAQQPQYYSTATGRYSNLGNGSQGGGYPTTGNTGNSGLAGGGGVNTNVLSTPGSATSTLYGGRYDNLSLDQARRRNTGYDAGLNRYGGYGRNTPNDQLANPGSYDYGQGTEYPGGGGYFLGTDQNGNQVGNEYPQYF